MPLTVGTRLGSYEIIGALGAGGMGEVYRARDTKLDRDVAIKVLPELFLTDANRVARFQREAKTLASLSHPNIAIVHGLEHADGVRALVMELVDGDDLSERIARGAVPIDEALPIAKQMADALEAAHEQGIVHRDLKPANIKVRPNGTIKVLDFGLAKAVDPVGSSLDVSQSPTLASVAMTGAGVILGTAAYMSPEQAKGKVVDKRADIWAFGCVLYEMLSGRRAFAGEDVTDFVIAVMTKEPDWAALPPATPVRIVDLLKRCLKKDVRQRLHDIADARVEIEDVISRSGLDGSPVAADVTPARVAGGTRLMKVAWFVGGAALAGAGVAGLLLSGVLPRGTEVDRQPLRVSIVHSEGNEVGAPAISPDGTRVAYGARRQDGMPMLWVHNLVTGQSRALDGTEDAWFPFWSPDARNIGFWASGTLKRIPADGGPVRVIVANVGNGGGGTWAPNDTIVYHRADLELFQVSANGGNPTAATKVKSKDWGHYWPRFLPDGRRFLFTAKLWTATAEASEQGVFLGSLDNLESHRLLPELSSAVYAEPGYLVFARSGVLMAVRFDLQTGRVTGDPFPLGAAVATDDPYFAGISSAADGTLAIRPPPALSILGVQSNASNTELRVFDRKALGSNGRLIGVPQAFDWYMKLNPGGHRLAASIVDPRTSTQDVWLIDLESGSQTALTSTHGFAGFPVWSPDGTRLAYAYQPPGKLDDVYIKDLRTGQTHPVIESPAVMEHPIAWSHNDKYLLVQTMDDRGDRSLSWWSFGAPTLTRLVGNGAQQEAVFSPDDRYIAFTSLESGNAEVYVTTFPERTRTWTLTTGGGRVLSWSKDGHEILVATLSGNIVAYPVKTDGELSFGEPTVLIRDVGFVARFSTTNPDHSTIVIRVSPNAAKDKGEIQLLFGWQDGVGKR